MTLRAWVRTGGGWDLCAEVYARRTTGWDDIDLGWVKLPIFGWVRFGDYGEIAPESFTIQALQNGKIRVTWGQLLTTGAEIDAASIRMNIVTKTGTQVNYTIVSDVATMEPGGSIDYTVPLEHRPDPTDMRRTSIRAVMFLKDEDNFSFTYYTNYVNTKPAPGLYSFIPTDSRTYSVSNGSWRTDSQQYEVHGGYFSSVYGNQRGFYFFGSSGPAWLCNGFVPQSGDFLMGRSGSSGFSGTWYFAPHNYTIKPTGLAVLDTTKETSTSVSGTDYATYVSMPSSWLSGFAANTLKGWGVDDGSNNYVVLDPYNIGNFAGLIRLVFAD